MNNIAPRPFYLFSVSTFTASTSHFQYKRNYPIVLTMFSQNIAGQHFQNPQEGVDPYLSSEYDTSPGALHIPGSGLRDNQKEPDLGSGLEPSKRKIWGMKRKTFVIMLGIFILLIIAVAAGVGVGVAVTKAKNNNIVSESAKSEPQGSSTPTDSSTSPTPSGGHPPVATVTTSISSSPTPTPIRNNTPLAVVDFNTSNIQLLYKHPDGSIRLLENNRLQWAGQSAQTKPTDDSGLAAIGWLEGTVQQVRVYTAGLGGALIESGWNSSIGVWDGRDISYGTEIAPLGRGSHLTAYTWFANGLQQFRVYYQGQDGYIREAAHNSTNNGDWWKGAAPTIQDFPRAKNGTGLAIVSFPNTDPREAKLYYQNMDGRLVSYDYKPAATFTQSWQNQDRGLSRSLFENGYKIHTNKFPLNSYRRPRIYTRWGTDGKLIEIWWTRKAGWNSWYMHDAVAPGVSAVSSTNDVNVFFQTKTGYLSDMSINRARG
ncbi:hypothetical protein B9Z19DRAFT_1069560 [Tuber borchii]|uniref:Uncharacterized protein n=1 Tax=Tuber borchii TaxID=42251 RepID=A0A2T6ZB36_TUBBO|nr:hypothetical protein B9Z19DRAFT_1069560 [Tuber borchii]